MGAASIILATVIGLDSDPGVRKLKDQQIVLPNHDLVLEGAA